MGTKCWGSCAHIVPTTTRAQLCTFTLVRLPARRAPLALATVPLRRARLAGTPGAAFTRLLGTGRGDSTAPGADLRRWATFVAWREPPDLAAWHRRLAGPSSDGGDGADRADRADGADGADGAECWTVLLETVSAHGRWAGHALDAPTAAPAPTGPVAVITRATVRLSRLRQFRSAVPPVDSVLLRASGRRASIGVGEWPVAVQGTFSVWADVDAMHRFAWSDPTHAEVVRRTRTERWYREELFARFRPLASMGTWDGRDPAA